MAERPSQIVSASGIVIHVLFFASGATALVYEVLWERSLRLAFGISTWSVAIVTAAFMGGLALGYWGGRARWIARFHPLRVYAAAEAGIAVYALGFPWMLGAVDRIYVAAGGSIAVRVALAFLLLVGPAALMGITLPVVARALRGSRSAGRMAGGLLAVNTAGAVFGAMASGWYLLRLYGADQTTELTTACNLGIAGLAFLIAWMVERPAVVTDAAMAPMAAPGSADAVARAATVASFAVGFGAMAMQVVWNRTLVCVVENNTTSFALILAAVLIGATLGGLLYSLVGGRRGRELRPFWLFFAAGIFLVLWVPWSIAILNRLYDVANAIQEMAPIRGIAGLSMVRLLAVLVPVVPAAAAAAFLVPALIDLLRERVDRGRGIGTIFAADAAGSVCGSLVCGFVMIPYLGLAGSLAGVAALTWIAVFGVLVTIRGRTRAWGRGLLGIAVAGVGGVLLFQPLTLMRWYDGHQNVRGELLLYREGAFGTLSVFQVGGQKDLLINCIEEVPNHRDALLLFKVLGHAPLLFRGGAEHVLVNALGGGITLGSVVRHPVEVDAVELVPEVREAMTLFAEENGNALEKTNWRLIHDDGRNFLRLSERRYGVITADATHPAAGESWPLYTREYYRIVREHLQPDGLFAQWLPLHNLAPEDFRASLATFRESFPGMLVLFVQRYCVLIGGMQPILVDAQALTGRMTANPAVAADLAAFGIERGEDLLKYLVLDGDGVARLTSGAEVFTDDRASVEYAELHRLGIQETFPLNVALLGSAMDPAALARRTGLPIGTFWARERLMRAQLRTREATPEAVFASLMDLEEARALAPRDADIPGPIGQLQTSLFRYLASEYQQILDRPDLERYLEILDYARRSRPDDAFLSQLLGAALLRLNRHEEAISPLERAADLRPDDVTYLSNLTYAYEQSGRLTEALEVLGRIEAREPGNAAWARVRERLEGRVREKGSVP